MRGKVIIIIRTKQNDLLCGSRIYPCSPHRGSLKILRGKGSPKPKFLRESIKANWNFQGGLNQNNFLGEGIGYFLEQCITIFKEKSLFEVENINSDINSMHNIVRILLQQAVLKY